jgi:hypothetical protein
MRWTQLKKRIEDSFADAVRGRVELWSTRYRHAHDGAREVWITIDGVRVSSMACWSYDQYVGTIARQLRVERNCTNWRDEEQSPGYRQAFQEAEDAARDNEILDPCSVHESLFEYLNLSHTKALKSSSPIVRSLAVLDRRFGKRRLMAFDPTNERSSLVIEMYRFRCLVEDVSPRGGRAPLSNPSRSTPA